MQEVLTNENADIKTLIANASEQFQKDSLDKTDN